MSALVSHSPYMLSPLVAGGIKHMPGDCVTLLGEDLDACTQLPWTPSHVHCPFADYALSPCALKNHSHEWDYMLSPEFLGRSLKLEVVSGTPNTHAPELTTVRILPNIPRETKINPFPC